jgi:AraC-like DNA-binding protein
MSTSTDAFAAFVRLLSSDLDDQGLRGATLASRANLSRYHFDRLISATAGEPPIRFRRRVLLERAAFRLALGGTGILEIALEAGYSSNEAFTRAFRRAYGRLPSAWRRSPGQIHLKASNGVHFHPPGSLRLPADSEVSPMNLLLKMVQHHIWLVGQLVDRAGSLSDAQLDDPIRLSVEGLDDEPTIRALLSRLVGQLDMWTSAIAGRGYDFAIERDEPLDRIATRLSRVGPAFEAEVAGVIDEGRLGDTFVDATCDPPEVFTYGGMVAHVLTFAAHRRTLVLGALASAGVTDLGSGDPGKWVAEVA